MKSDFTLKRRLKTRRTIGGDIVIAFVQIKTSSEVLQRRRSIYLCKIKARETDSKVVQYNNWDGEMGDHRNYHIMLRT